MRFQYVLVFLVFAGSLAPIRGEGNSEALGREIWKDAEGGSYPWNPDEPCIQHPTFRFGTSEAYTAAAVAATNAFKDSRLTQEVRANGIKANVQANIPMSNCGSLDDFSIELEKIDDLIDTSIQMELRNARLGIDNNYVIQITSQLNSNLCMVAKGEGMQSSVKLGDFQDCTSFRVDDDGLIRAFKQGGDLCLQASHGNKLENGSKMRFYPCDRSNEFQQFIWNENGNANRMKLKSSKYSDLCATSQGVNARKGDGVKMMVCDSLRPVDRQVWFGD